MATNPILENAIEEAVKGWQFASDGAREDFISLRSGEFSLVNGVPIHKETRKSIADMHDYYKTNRDYYFPKEFSESLADRAFIGAGNITARVQLVKEVGEKQALEIARSYGHDSLHSTKKNGVAPNGSDKDKPSTNPWSAEFVARVGVAAANEARVGIIKRLGTKVAASMAHSAGATLSGTQLRGG
jgi:hypothetical protein